MNRTEGRASGEVPGSQPPGRDLADEIADRCGYALELARGIPVVLSSFVFAPIIRESLAPIREALEEGDRDYFLRITKAFRLLRGEELSGNRGIDGGK